MSIANAAPPLRPFQLEDMLRLEQIGSSGYFPAIALAPDGGGLAFVRVRPLSARADHTESTYLFGNERGDVWVQRAPGMPVVNITRGEIDGAGWWAPQWSPDGKRLALLTNRDGSVTVWVWESEAQRLKKLSSRNLNILGDGVTWVDPRHLLCSLLPEGASARLSSLTPQLAAAAWEKNARGEETTASVLESGIPIDLSQRPHAELIRIDVVNGTSTLFASANTLAVTAAPRGGAVAYLQESSVFVPHADTALRTYFYLMPNPYELQIRRADGRLLQFDPALPREIDRTSLRWWRDGQELSLVGYPQSRASPAHRYRVNIGNGRVRDLGAQPPAADIVPSPPVSQLSATVRTANDDNGTFVWRVLPRTGALETLMSANGFLREIEAGTFRKIAYTGLDGQSLEGWVLLPPGFSPQRRYPLITYVYAGAIAVGDPRILYPLNDVHPLNLQIPAGRGYAVLIPSMPLAPEGEIDDIMLKLPNGVLPAVDQAIALGIADPQRLFLMGHSFGGFSTYGLVTQTTRFKAAVAMAGVSDLITIHSAIDPRRRYTDGVNDVLFYFVETEWADRLVNPPWKDLGRYLRNSPIFHVDRVQTPLLIAHGDLDFVPIQQAEEFFMSLYRQGKRAQFVRYWGEDHILANPANIRDMWQRVFAWFDEFGGGATAQPRS